MPDGGLQMLKIRSHRFELAQDEDFTVSITAKDQIKKIEAVSYPRDSPLTTSCNEGETAQFRSVVGALSWITRQCTPELLHREANRVLEAATQPADYGLVFKGGAAQWNQDMIVLTVTDASWAGEEDIVKGSIEPFRSQRARFNGLAGSGFIEGNSDH
eukprot:9325961-Pyramimonas_sp.AAC.1